ncbi:hypothetical protein SAMN05720472_1748 [Fibrobacter sp. UWR3]|nr:hypothetical protein SAMN05720472_1748 [Fibrobacter sp. UWR3]
MKVSVRFGLPKTQKRILLPQAKAISADQITNCDQFGLPNGATHSPRGPESSLILGEGIWLAKRTLKRSDRVSVQAISGAKYISALQQNINLVQASLPLNRELQFNGKPQGLTVTRFSSRYTHPVFCVIAINKFPPEPSHIFGGGIWLAKRTLKRSDRVSVQAISEAKYISALQQNINLVQASLPLNRELQFKGKPQGLTVTRFSSRYTHPVFCVIAINKFLPEPSLILGEGIWLAKRTLKRSDRVSVQAISEAKYISAQQKKHPALSNRVLFVRRRIFIGASTSSAIFITSCRPCHPCPGPWPEQPAWVPSSR